MDHKTSHYLIFSLQADLNFALQTNCLLHYQKQLQMLLTVNYDHGRFIWKFKIKDEPFSDIQKLIFERSFWITELLYHYWALSTASANNWSLFICDKLEGCHWDHEKIKFCKTPSSLLDWSMSPWKHNKEEGERCISYIAFFHTLTSVFIFSLLFSIHSYSTDKENLFNNQERL